MEINRKLLEALRTDINEALKAVGKKHGVTIEAGNARFSALDIDMHLNIAIAKTDGFDPEKERWDKSILFTGLKPEDYGAKIVLGKETFTISGFNPKAQKNRILIRNAAGTEYVADVPSVLKALGRESSSMDGWDDALAKATFHVNATSLGFTTLEYGYIVESGGERYKLIEVNTRAPKYPFVAIRLSTGDMVKLPRELIAIGKNTNV